MIGIFQGSPEGRANECQRRAKGGLPRATSKKQGKRRAWEGALPKAGQFGSYGHKIAHVQSCITRSCLRHLASCSWCSVVCKIPLLVRTLGLKELGC